MKNNLTGKRFGRLSVISWHHKDFKRRTHFWLCKCDCGKEKVIGVSNLQRKVKPTFSCGCFRYDKITGLPAANRLDYAKSNLNSLIHSYRKGAKNRNIKFCLSEEQFEKLTKSECYYCGIKPSQIHSKRETYGQYIYNGIDRVDPDESYVLSNCVACCKTCNYAKRLMKLEEFVKWVIKVYTRICKES